MRLRKLLRNHLRFEIRHAERREEVFSDSDPVVFGRDPSCDVVVRNPRCSRRHASVRQVSGGFHLLDLGSSNGVYVLGQKIEDAILREGDVFSMGDVFIRILPEDDVPETLAMPGSRSAPNPRAGAARPEVRIEASGTRAAGAERPSDRPGQAAGLFAPSALGAASVAIGLVLIMSPLILGPEMRSMAFGAAGIGLISALSGLGFLAAQRWARALHYLLFGLWTLSCLLAPFGVIGLAYQIWGEDYPDSDLFLAVVIGIAAVLAIATLIGAALLARLYVPAPVPVL